MIDRVFCFFYGPKFTRSDNTQISALISQKTPPTGLEAACRMAPDVRKAAYRNSSLLSFSLDKNKVSR